jgi:hypothetical protein
MRASDKTSVAMTVADAYSNSDSMARRMQQAAALLGKAADLWADFMYNPDL